LTGAPTPLHDPFASSLAGRRLGRYEVLARLASGGMAGVYVARALGVAGFERLFAIKVLHPHLAHEEEFISMFLDEARLAARIRHPNVVPTIDISDTADAGYYLVMDYIEGDHLGALLQTAFKAGGRLPAPVTLRIVVDALDGLAAAHNLTDEHGRRLNLVHRDVSPHNIMVSTDGISRLTDFGVAKAEVRLSTTREGQFKGKLAYMAPEHASSGEADQRSDLFSMAIILWECLTGRRLFRSENHAATLNKICLEPIPMPSEVDPALAPFDSILARGLARDPAERFQTAEEFAEALETEAPRLGGLGHQRAVSKLVRELAAEKLSSDAELIRSAIAFVAIAPEPQTTPAPRPAPSGAGRPVAAAPPEPAGAIENDIEDLADALEPVVAAEPPAKRGRAGLWIVGTLLTVAAVLGVAVTLLDENSDRVTTSPLQEVAAPELAPIPATTPSADAPTPGTPAPGSVTATAEAPAPGTPSDVAPAAADATGAAPAELGSAVAPAGAAATPEAAPSHASDATPSAKPDGPPVERHSSRRTRASSTQPAAPTTATATETAKAKPVPKPAPKAKAAEPDDLMLNPYRN
jgi:hypothetical protein